MSTSRFLLPLLALSAACGSLADPNAKVHEPVATLSGKLTTSTPVPANTHVALVWRSGSGLAIGADSPVVNQQFSIALDAPPPDADFFPYDAGGGLGGSGSAGGSSSSSGGNTNVPVSTPSAPPPTAGAAGTQRAAIHPLDTASGSVGDGLAVAAAGFIVYVDGNGDGALDLSAASPDQTIGGASDLVLVYLKNGSALDYQRLADTHGATPGAGYNLALTEGKWVSLDLVDLTFTSNPQLPSAVCGGVAYSTVDSTGPNGGVASSGSTGSAGSSSSGGGSGGSSSGSSSGSSPGSSGSSSGGGSNGYPDPSDPNLHCAPDGRSYSYDVPTTCPTPTPPPYAVCSGGAYAIPPCVSGGPVEGGGLAPDAPVPAGWPCPVATTASDAGVAPSN